MARPRGLGFGGFLIGLGAGWMTFRYMTLTTQMWAWLMIIAGSAIVASAVVSYYKPGFNAGSLVSAVAGGLILSLVMTQGLGFVNFISDSGGVYPYSEEEVRNFDGGVAVSDVLFSTENVNGIVDVSTWSSNSYSINVTVIGKGTSESDALSMLGNVETDVSTFPVGGRLEIVLTIDVPRTLWKKATVNVEVKLPASATVDLDVSTTNGELRTTDLTGGDLYLTLTNGNMVIDDVTASTIHASTTNGNVQGTLEAEDVSARTTNGRITLEVPSQMSGSYDLSSTNGNIEVSVSPSQDVGFKVDLSVSNGVTSISLPDLDYTTNTAKHKVAETEGYSSMSVKIEVEASTTNGNVEVGS